MHFIILDLELTCWQGHAMDRQQEIIEIGAYRLNGFGEWIDHFHTLVRPLTHPRLSAYCQELTGIPQAGIDAARHFPAAYEQWADWIDDADGDQLLCTWGAKDVPALRNECRRFRLEADVFPESIDLKAQFARIHRLSRPAGLVKALDLLGLEFEGDHHRALDDAYNTARLFGRLLDQWAY